MHENTSVSVCPSDVHTYLHIEQEMLTPGVKWLTVHLWSDHSGRMLLSVPPPCVCVSQTLMQKVGKRRQTPPVQDIPEDQSVCVCVCVCFACLYTCSYKCLWLSVWVNLLSWVSPRLLLWHPGLCLCVCHGKRVNVVWSVCVCVCVCFDGGVEPPRANGDTAAAIYPNTSQEFSGWIRRRDERGGEQHRQIGRASCRERV